MVQLVISKFLLHETVIVPAYLPSTHPVLKFCLKLDSVLFTSAEFKCRPRLKLQGKLLTSVSQDQTTFKLSKEAHQAAGFVIPSPTPPGLPWPPPSCYTRDESSNVKISCDPVTVAACKTATISYVDRILEGMNDRHVRTTASKRIMLERNNVVTWMGRHYISKNKQNWSYAYNGSTVYDNGNMNARGMAFEDEIVIGVVLTRKFVVHPRFSTYRTAQAPTLLANSKKTYNVSICC
ncbi:hypothetical protein D9756_002764 [Leucocoprinus leucothites]|uniref:Uncharacterized protein n=1 Tax=Leucocoprinus leucothites TaxID=201217 RepID=A0A8H5GBR3_9AGAR|nr:hypothetical protein D9756_002764 [Leucoagaricus leucothites]